MLDFNLGAAPVGGVITRVVLLFENSGTVDTKFHFLLPQDLQLELEYWAETGEYTSEELHQVWST